MVVDNFDVLGITLPPSEENPPLVIDANAPLAGTVPLEAFKPISGQHAKGLK
jgi:hypothetical protein